MTFPSSSSIRRAAIIASLGLFCGAPSYASQITGISGFSGNPASGGATCTFCHAGGLPPTVSLSGPTTLFTGQKALYRLKVSGGQNVAAGLDVSVSVGTLTAVEADTYILNKEVTHSQPRVVDANGDAIFTFEYTAPIGSATVTMYGAGNSVNFDFLNTGDLSDATTLTITVIDCDVTFVTYGSGLAGSGGFVPSLTGDAGTCTGSYVIHIDNALGSASGFLLVGFAQASIPFHGGSLLVSPINMRLYSIRVGGIPLPGAGNLDIPGIDVSAFPGLTLYLQSMFFDPGAVDGLSMTNGLEMKIL